MTELTAIAFLLGCLVVVEILRAMYGHYRYKDMKQSLSDDIERAEGATAYWKRLYNEKEAAYVALRDTIELKCPKAAEKKAEEKRSHHKKTEVKVGEATLVKKESKTLGDLL